MMRRSETHNPDHDVNDHDRGFCRPVPLSFKHSITDGWTSRASTIHLCAVLRRFSPKIAKRDLSVMLQSSLAERMCKRLTTEHLSFKLVGWKRLASTSAVTMPASTTEKPARRFKASKWQVSDSNPRKKRGALAAESAVGDGVRPGRRSLPWATESAPATEAARSY
jgi:hypothetical protein